MEALRLRVKDVDLGRGEIVVREGKGNRDRVTMLPAVLVNPLQAHLQGVRVLHNEDIARGLGEVYLPFALSRKYPAAGREWAWQYVFPSHKLSVDPRSGVWRRHHLDEQTIQRAVRAAAISGNAAVEGRVTPAGGPALTAGFRAIPIR